MVTGGRDDGEGPGAGRFQNQMRVAVVVVSFPPFLSRPLATTATGLSPRFGSDAVASGVGRGGSASRGRPTSQIKRRLAYSCQRLVHGSAAESIERLRLGLAGTSFFSDLALQMLGFSFQKKKLDFSNLPLQTMDSSI